MPETQRLGRGNGAGERSNLACGHREPGGLRPNGGGHVQGGPQPSLRAARIGPGRPGGNPRRLRLVRIAHVREIEGAAIYLSNGF